MHSLAWSLAAPVLAGLLGWTGSVKLFGRATARQAPKTALARILSSSERAVLVLRGTGAVELLLAAGLLVVPGSPLPGAATAVLGAGFLGYLGYARVTVPQSSCGCSANENTITWRALARAAAVLLGGVAVALAGGTWWDTLRRRPAASLGFALVAALVLLVLSADLDRWWLLPLRRLRLRVLGHPFGGGSDGGPVPVAATVQLLENSLAWQAASTVVRSGLLDHWEEDGWRILQYSGVHQAEGDARPVVVLFALDAAVSLDSAREPAVRVSVVDADTGESVAVELPTPARRTLPLAEQPA